MCCGSLGHKESDMTEQVNCTELNIFIIVIPSWIHPLIIMYCPLCVLMVFILKSILSDMSIATPAFFWSLFTWNIFFQPFTFSLYMSLVLR